METTISNYEKQAIDFLAATTTDFKAEFLENGKHFPGDKETRDIYKITLSRGSRKYSFRFGQSISKSGFYYTKGVRKIDIDRKLIGDKNLASVLKRQDWDFLNNGKSDKIHTPEAPTAYDVLACLTKSDPGTFENFCSDFGYDTDSRTAETTYNAVASEWKEVKALFTDVEIEELQNIQ